MIAGDVSLAPEMGSSAAGEALLARASQREPVRQAEVDLFHCSDGDGEAEPTHNLQEEAALPVLAHIHSVDAAPSSSLTMLDVGVAWRELPARSSGKEFALLRVLHEKAHGASCMCRGKEKPPRDDRRWANAIHPVTRDRRAIGATREAQWAKLPFHFDASGGSMSREFASWNVKHSHSKKRTPATWSHQRPFLAGIYNRRARQRLFRKSHHPPSALRS